MKMLRFEIKKVFSKTKNRITIIVLLVILIATSILTINRVAYVDASGNHLTGISAAKNTPKGAFLIGALGRLSFAALRSSASALTGILRLPFACSQIGTVPFRFRY